MDLKLRSAGVNDAGFLAWLILTAGRALKGMCGMPFIRG